MNSSEKYPEGEILIRELFEILWEKKKFIIGATFISAIFSVIFSLMLTNYYVSASVLVARDGSGSSSGLLSQYSGLASLAGISIPGVGGGGTATEVIEIIKSREFANHLSKFDEIKQSVMAAKSYDSSSQELTYDSSIYDAEKNEWIEPEPSYLQLHREYRDILSISTDIETGFISISIEHMSPVFAKNFLTLIITEANKLKREKDIETSTNALKYLKDELSKTSFVEIKESINLLIESQLETQMMAKINEEYSLITLEPPFIPDKKSKPNRAMICILGTILGAMISVIFILFQHYFYKANEA